MSDSQWSETSRRIGQGDTVSVILLAIAIKMFPLCIDLVTMVDLLFKVVVSQEQNCFPIVQDTLSIRKILLDVLPQDNMLSSHVIQSGWNGGDSGGCFSPERLFEGDHVAGYWREGRWSGRERVQR